TVVADRGFADVKFYALLGQLGFEYVVRSRADVLVTSEEAETKRAAEWVPEGGRAKVLRGARVTAAMVPVGAVVCVKRKGMKDSW
ncbi:IS4 family transposase, partial [Corallococcus sp. RDP092CA]